MGPETGLKRVNCTLSRIDRQWGVVPAIFWENIAAKTEMPGHLPIIIVHAQNYSREGWKCEKSL